MIDKIKMEEAHEPSWWTRWAEKISIREIPKCHFDTQKEKLVCSQSLDVFLSCSASNTNIRFGCCVFKYVYSTRKESDYLNYLANAKEDSKSSLKIDYMGQTIFWEQQDFDYNIIPALTEYSSIYTGFLRQRINS